jgi:His Kinase A (phospho-acceptor) domain/Histidine kinase-, DNA gyrase B-, and HSP90-like ATPase
VRPLTLVHAAMVERSGGCQPSAHDGGRPTINDVRGGQSCYAPRPDDLRLRFIRCHRTTACEFGKYLGRPRDFWDPKKAYTIADAGCVHRNYPRRTRIIGVMFTLGGREAMVTPAPSWHPGDLASGPRKALDDAPTAFDLVRQIAHDLRQPVAAIQALTSVAMLDAQPPDSVRQRLGQIAEQAAWMSKIICDLLASEGPAQLNEVVDVAALVRDAVASERLTYPGLFVLRQADADPRYVVASRMRLRRALANVLANATRAAGDDGRVELTERPHGDMELIEVVDNGPGFGKVAHGHGIGLGVTRRMLAECGGRMEHERLPTDQTAVRLFLPTAPARHLPGAL